MPAQSFFNGWLLKRMLGWPQKLVIPIGRLSLLVPRNLGLKCGFLHDCLAVPRLFFCSPLYLFLFHFGILGILHFQVCGLESGV